MVGKFIAWLLRRAGYDLVPAAELTAKVRRLGGKLDELDDVVCSNIDDIEKLRRKVKKLRRKAAPVPRLDDKSVYGNPAEILAEFLNGPQPSGRNNE